VATAAATPVPGAAPARGPVLAIVPAHDEAPRVAAVVRGLIEQGLPVLAVDDGSTDGTGEVAREAGARVLRLEPNQGKGAALKAGFRLALGETVSEALPVPSVRVCMAPPCCWIAVRCKEGQLQVGHVGDARLYRLRGDRLERMTVDHSFLQAQLATGRVTADEARVSRSRHLVTRALGSGDQTHPDIAEHRVETGDLYLVCTDGLHELVDERDIGAALTALDPNAELAAETLVTMANDRGGTDNVSVIVVKIGAPESEPPGERGLGLFARMRAWLAK